MRRARLLEVQSRPVRKINENDLLMFPRKRGIRVTFTERDVPCQTLAWCLAESTRKTAPVLSGTDFECRNLFRADETRFVASDATTERGSSDVASSLC